MLLRSVTLITSVIFSALVKAFENGSTYGSIFFTIKTSGTMEAVGLAIISLTLLALIFFWNKLNDDTKFYISISLVVAVVFSFIFNSPLLGLVTGVTSSLLAVIGMEVRKLLENLFKNIFPKIKGV